MDISNLSFTETKFRRGYDQQDVDQFLDLVAANLALPLAERTLRAEQVTAVRFQSTMIRAGYDQDEVDAVLDRLGVELGLPSPSELPDAPSPTAPPPVGSARPAVEPPTTAAGPVDDFRPDPTF